jgi:fumarate hydratase class II
VGNDATIAWANALGSNFDLNVMMPVIAYNLLQSIDILANAATHLADKCVDAEKHLSGKKVDGVVGIEADEARCRDLIELSLAMCTALAPRIGYDAAAALAKRAFKDGKNVRQVALELVAGHTVEEVTGALALADRPAILAKHGVPSAAEIESLLEPHGQTIRGTGVGGSAGG